MSSSLYPASGRSKNSMVSSFERNIFSPESFALSCREMALDFISSKIPFRADSKIVYLYSATSDSRAALFLESDVISSFAK
ncbi:hypothetical protein D9M68_708440 [compost metagenome]